MNKPNLTDYFRAKELVERTSKAAKEYIQSDAPLEDRWEIYVQIEKELPIDCCCFSLDAAERDLECRELTYYDDLYMERYEERPFTEIVSQLQERALDDPKNKETIDTLIKEHGVKHCFQLPLDVLKELRNSVASLPTFRDVIMKSGYGGCKNDW